MTGLGGDRLGITLQNPGACFVANPKHPNCIGPGKRPLHTIIPAMARKDGLVDMGFGVMGGDCQRMGQLSVAVNCYVYGMGPQEALDQSRYFPKGGKVLAESGVSAAVRDGLMAKGHVLDALQNRWAAGKPSSSITRAACLSVGLIRARMILPWVVEHSR